MKKMTAETDHRGRVSTLQTKITKVDLRSSVAFLGAFGVSQHRQGDHDPDGCAETDRKLGSSTPRGQVSGDRGEGHEWRTDQDCEHEGDLHDPTVIDPLWRTGFDAFGHVRESRGSVLKHDVLDSLSALDTLLVVFSREYRRNASIPGRRPEHGVGTNGAKYLNGYDTPYRHSTGTSHPKNVSTL